MHLNGIHLEPLTLETAELVRVWRNSAAINQFMDYKDLISKEQQIEWFDSIKNSESHYFIIMNNNQPIGMTHLNRVDQVNRTAYAGLFIGEENYHGTGAALSASILLLDFALDQLQLNSIFAKVNDKNSTALHYNEAIGFVLRGTESTDFSCFELKKESFKAKREMLISFLSL